MSAQHSNLAPATHAPMHEGSHAGRAPQQGDGGRGAEPGAARNPAVERVLWAFLVVIILAVTTGSIWRVRQIARSRPAPLATIAPPTEISGLEVPDFSLLDKDGNAVTLADLKGKVWVADFFFTHCSGKCQMMTMRMATLKSALPAADEARLVSITIDPARDSPEALAAWAKQYGAEDERWLFLTGQLRDIIRLAREGFRLGVTENPAEHPVKLTLIDRAARIRGYFDLDDDAMRKLRREFESLLKEARP